METDLEYDTDFPERAGTLLVEGQAFTFVVRKEARDALRPHLEDGEVDVAGLAVTPQLQPLLAVLMVAQGQDRQVVIREHDREVFISIGAG